jgi:hypothetical protein
MPWFLCDLTGAVSPEVEGFIHGVLRGGHSGEHGLDGGILFSTFRRMDHADLADFGECVEDVRDGLRCNSRRSKLTSINASTQ